MNRFYKTAFSYCFTFLCLLAGFKGFAEGSKDLYPTGATGDRAYLMSTNMVGAGTWPFPALGTHYVYVNPGEKVLAASSAQGIANGQIRLTAPNGTVYTSTVGNTTGQISNRAAELAGPLPNAGGYTPFSRTVGAGEGGIWMVEFIPTGTIGNNTNEANNIAATAEWSPQPNNINAIAAWDVSVLSASNAFITGRVYATVMNMYVTTGRYYGRIFVQTNDGYLYRVRNNGIAGIGFISFVNNKGLTTATGDASPPSYKSLDATTSTTIKDPRSTDGATSITQKIFYSVPNTDLPTSSTLPSGATTWLKVAKIVPTVNSITIDGVEGTSGQVSSKGAYIKFNASQAGNFRITLTGSGSFVTRTIIGSAAQGPNSIYWDGKDGSGTRPGLGTAAVKADIQLQGGEVHFPLIDVETNASGMIIEQMDDAGTNPVGNLVFWDDSGLSNRANASSPLFNGNTGSGLNSITNGHIWGTDYGNERIMDTWTYILGTVASQNTSLVIQQADLQVQSITPSVSSVPTGQKVNYDVVVVNNGPSDVTGAPFKFVGPNGFVINTADVTYTTSCGTVGTATIDANGDYNTKVDMPNGCIITFHVKGTPGASLVGSNIATEASIMRPPDVTDPDATNPDPATPPTDPHVECLNGTAPPEHCNNIKNNSGVAVTIGADIVTVKVPQVAGKTTYAPGEIVTYVITVTNNGPNNATNVRIQDAAPTGTTIIDWTASATAGTVTAPHTTGTGNIDETVASFPNGGQLTYVVRVQTAANATANLVNNAVITSGTPDPDPSCTGCSNTLTPAPSADIVTVKSTAVTSFVPGGTAIVYTITATNNGPSDAKNVRLQDPLPTGATSMSWSGSLSTGVSLGTGTGSLNVTLLTLANGVTATYTITVNTNAAYAGANMVNTVTQSSATTDPNPGCSTCSVTTPSTPVADVVTVKSAGVTSFVPGGAAIVYTITATNNGPSAAQNVRIQDALPTGAASMSWTATISSGTLPATSGTGNLDQTITTLGNGAVATYTVTVVTDAAYTGANIVNTVTENSPTNDPNPGCTACTVTIPSAPAADVVTVKSAGVTNFVPGGAAIVYTITATNNGPSDAQNVRIQDALPTGATSMSWSATISSGTLPVTSGIGDLDETIATLANGAVATYTVTVLTDANYTGANIVNTAIESSPTTDPNPGCTACTVTIPSAPVADVVTVKSTGVTSFVPGGAAIVYTITVTNNGPSAAQNVRIQDALPTGATSMSWSATISSGSLSATGGTGNLDQTITTLANGAVATYTITVNTSAAYTGANIVNTAVENSPTTDPNPGCTACTVTIPSAPSADVVTVKSAGVTSFVPGGAAIIYTITVTNNGPSDAQNVRIQDALPTGATSMSWSATISSGTLPATGGTGNLDQTIATLANGAVATYTVTVNTDGAYTGANIVNTAVESSTTTDPNPGCTACTVTIPSAPNADVVTVKSTGVTSFVPGGAAIVYTITVTNNGPSDAKNVRIQDALPTGATSMSWTAAVSSGTLPATSGSTALDQTITTLANGAVATYTVTVVTDANYTGANIVNTAVESSPTTDPNPGCTTCAVTIPSAPSADVVTVKSAGVTSFVPGGAAIVYTITVTNNGPSAAQNVRIQDALPTGATSMSWTATVSSGTLPATSGNTALDETIATLRNGAVATYTVTVNTNAAYTGANIVNTAIENSPTTDPNPGCTACTVTIPSAPSADVVTVKSAGVTSFAPGGAAIVYTITVTNNGPSDAQNVRIQDALPAGATSMSWTATVSSGTLPANNGTGNLDETIATLANGAVATYTVTVATDAAYTGANIVNTVTQSSPTTDPNPGCTACTVTIPSAPSADVVTVKSAGVTSFTPGGAAIVYTITVTNNGPSDAKNVRIQDALPTGATSMSWTATISSGTLPATSGNTALDQTIATLANGAVATYTVTVNTDGAYTGANIVNTAVESSTTTDPNPGCTACTVTLPSVPGADVVTVKSTGVTSFVPGGAAIVYTITVTNNGPSAAQNVRIQDALPAGAASMSWTAAISSGTLPATSGNTALDETIASLANGAVATYTVTVNTNAAYTGANIVNTVTQSSPTTDPNPGCTACTVTIPSAPSADVVTVKSAGVTSFVPGGAAIVYTITATNNGPSDAQNVRIQDALPAGATSMSWTATISSGTLPAASGNTALDQTIATLANGAVATYTVTVVTDAAYTGANIVNTVTQSSPTTDPNPGCTACTVTIPSAPSADVVTVKSAGVTSFTPGGAAIVYTITVTNNGPSDAKDVRIQDALPTGATSMNWTATISSGTLPAASGNTALDQTIATLPNGAVATYTVTVNTNAAYTGANIVNTVTESATTPDPNSGTPCAACTVTIPSAPSADVVTVKSTGVTSVTPGGAAIVYTITVTNNGPSDAKNVRIQDALPAGATSMSWSAIISSGTLPAASGTGDLDETIATLANGAVATYTVTVNTDGSYTGANIVNTVTQTSTTPDPNGGTPCTTCTVTTPSAPSADVVTVKSAGVTSFVPGGAAIVYTITLTNNGPSDAKDVRIQDALPTGATSMSWTAAISSGTLPATSGNTALDQTIATLANGAVATYTVTVNTDGSYTGANIVNTVTQTSTTPDPNSGTPCAACTVTIPAAPSADVVTVKSAGVTSFVPGGAAIVYTITATNNGPSDAQNVRIQDALPTGATSMSWTATISSGTLPATSGNTALDQTIATLPNGAVATYTVTVNTNASYTGANIVNTAVESATTPDPNSSTPCAACTVTIPSAPSADIVTVKSAGVTSFTPGGAAIIYTITVTNNGPSDAKSVRIQDALPTGAASMSWTAAITTGTLPATSGNGNLDQTIATLADGAVATYTVTVNTDATYTGANIVNTVTQTSTTPDPNSGTPCTTCTVTIPSAPSADVEIVKVLNNPAQTAFNPGSAVVYTITVTNHGPSAAQNVEIKDQLPVGGKSMSWTAAVTTGTVTLPATSGNGNLDQIISTLPNSAKVTYTVTVNTDPAYTGATIVNHATETSDTDDPDGGNPCTTCDVTLPSQPLADVVTVKKLANSTQTSFKPGDAVIYTITVTNNGPSDAKSVRIQDALPTGGNSMSWTAAVTTGTVTLPAVSGNGNLDQTITTLPDNAVVTYTVTVVTDAAFTGTQMVNTVTESSPTTDPNSGTPCATCTVPLPSTPSADIVTVKRLKNTTQTTFNPGDDVEYVITVTNNGPSDAKDVRIQDALPAGAASMSWTAAVTTGTVSLPATSGSTALDQTIANFPNGAVVTYNITMATDPAFTGSQIINVAKEESTTDDPNANNPCTTCETPLQSVVSADVETVKRLKNAGQTTFKPGEAVEYVITVTNHGPSDARTVRVQDALPTGATSMSWTATQTGGVTLPATSGNSSLDQTLATLPNGAVVTYAVTVQTPSSFTGNLVNVATESSATPDPNGSTPCADCAVSTPAAPSADLVTVKTTKAGGKTTFAPGEAVVYTITVTNNGPSDAKNVNVADNAPTGTAITNWTASVTPATVTLPNASGAGNLNETIASLPDGAVVTYEVTVQTPPTFSGTLSNTAIVNSGTPDPVPGCAACVTTPLNPVPGADIVTVKALKNPAQTNFIPGEAVVYTITVTNNGPSDAANVSIADNAPAGTTISAWTATATGMTPPNASGTGNLDETIANMPNGAVIVYEVTVQTPVTFKDDLVNTAIVNSATPDPVSGCPACTAPTVPVQIIPPVAVDDITDTKANNDVTVPVLDNDNAGENGGSPIVPTTVEVTSQPVHGTIKVNADGSITYTPDPGYVGADSLTYRVQDQGGNWSNVATVRINVVSNELDIPNVITPNGDGNNDKLVIKGLEKYQQNEIVIFNRWNNMLFRSKNYQNDWDGQGLNAGTYFYTLKVQDANGQWQTRNGFIMLMR